MYILGNNHKWLRWRTTFLRYTRWSEIPVVTMRRMIYGVLFLLDTKNWKSLKITFTVCVCAGISFYSNKVPSSWAYPVLFLNSKCTYVPHTAFTAKFSHVTAILLILLVTLMHVMSLTEKWYAPPSPQPVDKQLWRSLEKSNLPFKQHMLSSTTGSFSQKFDTPELIKLTSMVWAYCQEVVNI